MAPSNDLLIIGPGSLGGYAGKLWLEAHPGCTVVGQTRTDSSHERLSKLGLKPAIAPEADVTAERYDNILFAAPPTAGNDYLSEVLAALSRWTREGSFVFTGSMSMAEANPATGVADEDSPRVPRGQTTPWYSDQMMDAEDAILEAGGCVIRYVGLYHAHRGAHSAFLKRGEVARWGGFMISLIHYEDAAALAVAVLSGQGNEGNSPHRSRVFVGCDGTPVTFEGMMQDTTASGKFEGSCKFTGEKGEYNGKPTSNVKTREALGGWEPKYQSFAAFMAAGAEDFGTATGLL